MMTTQFSILIACTFLGACDDTPDGLVPIEKRAQAAIRLEGFPDWLEIGFGSLWVSNAGLGAVQRIDPGTNKVIAEIKVKNPCAAWPPATVRLWVASRRDKSIYRIDAQSNKVTATIPLTIADSEASIAAGRERDLGSLGSERRSLAYQPRDE